MVLAGGTIEIAHGEEDGDGENAPIPFEKGVEVIVSQNRPANPVFKRGPRLITMV